jgi:hypothetical protein
LGIVIDGQPLGDHLLPPDSSPTINEDVKKVNERIVVAKLLVAADLDGQLESLTSLKERPQPTADFDAMLHDGQLVKIEVSSLADPSEKQSNSTLNKTLWGLTAAVNEIPRAPNSPHVHFAFPAVPFPSQRKRVVSEMVVVIATLVPTVKPSSRLYEADARHPMLEALGVHWNLESRRGDATTVTVRPWRMPSPDIETLVDQITYILPKKQQNYKDYSDGAFPVWLVLLIDAWSHFPLSAIEPLTRRVIHPAPFDRLIIGCNSGALVYERDGERRYVDFN